MQENNDAATRAEDRQAIADLVHVYALHIRRGEAEACAALFAEGGCFEVREADPRDWAGFRVVMRAEGRAAVEGFVARAVAGQHRVPMVANLIVTLAGDEAHASSLMVARAWPEGDSVTGEYSDSFVREGGVWRFALRVYTVFRVVEG